MRGRRSIEVDRGQALFLCARCCMLVASKALNYSIFISLMISLLAAFSLRVLVPILSTIVNAITTHTCQSWTGIRCIYMRQLRHQHVRTKQEWGSFSNQGLGSAAAPETDHEHEAMPHDATSIINALEHDDFASLFISDAENPTKDTRRGLTGSGQVLNPRR